MLGSAGGLCASYSGLSDNGLGGSFNSDEPKLSLALVDVCDWHKFDMPEAISARSAAYLVRQSTALSQGIRHPPNFRARYIQIDGHQCELLISDVFRLGALG
jgi:hypothetical protein